MRNFFKNNKRGFTLVEALVAISIFTVSILGMISVSASGISNTNYAKNKITASYLAQEGIEYIRNMRDTYTLYTSIPGNTNTWNKFRAELAPCNSNNKCGFDSSLPFSDNGFLFGCSPDKCKLYIKNGGYNVDTNGVVDSGFVRKVWAEVIDQSKELKIFSNVSWTQGSVSYNITFSENLFNWMD